MRDAASCAEQRGDRQQREPSASSAEPRAAHLHRLRQDPQRQQRERRRSQAPGRGARAARVRRSRSEMRCASTSAPNAPSSTAPSCSGKTAPGRIPAIASPARRGARAGGVDHGTLRDRHDGADAGQKVEAVVREPDADAERHERVGVADGDVRDGARPARAPRVSHAAPPQSANGRTTSATAKNRPSTGASDRRPERARQPLLPPRRPARSSRRRSAARRT